MVYSGHSQTRQPNRMANEQTRTGNILLQPNDSSFGVNTNLGFKL